MWNKIYLTLVIIIVFQYINGQNKNFIDQPYLETFAKVDTLISPNEIYLEILLSEKDEQNKISVEEMESKMIQKLNSLGINIEKQLKLESLESNFKKYLLKQKDILKSKAYELKVFDSRIASKVLMELEDIGISNVSLTRVDYSKMEELKLILKAKTIEKAKKQTIYMLKPLNQKLLRAILIEDIKSEQKTDYNNQLREIKISYSSKRKQDYESPQTEFNPILVTSEINVKFAIE